MSKERDTLRNRVNQLSVTISGINIPKEKESLLGKNNFDYIHCGFKKIILLVLFIKLLLNNI
jgi:hypothetical protein